MIVRQILDVVYAASTAAHAFRDVQAVSLKRLRSLLENISDTSFGREHGLYSDMSLEEFSLSSSDPRLCRLHALDFQNKNWRA